MIKRMQKKIRETQNTPFYKRLVKWGHVKQLSGAILGMGIILLLVTPVFNLAESAYERWLPTQSWFIYVDIIPVRPEFKVGETPMFYSNLEYKRPIRMQWQDRLVCLVGDNEYLLDIQTEPSDGPVLREKGIFNNIDPQGNKERRSWAYDEEAIPEDATACYLEASATGYTPKYNYPKEWNLVTPWFLVNVEKE